MSGLGNEWIGSSEFQSSKWKMENGKMEEKILNVE